MFFTESKLIMLVTVTFFPLANQSIFQLNACEDTEIYKTLFPSKAVLPFAPTFDSAFGILNQYKKEIQLDMRPGYIETLGCFSDHRNVVNWKVLEQYSCRDLKHPKRL